MKRLLIPCFIGSLALILASCTATNQPISEKEAISIAKEEIFKRKNWPNKGDFSAIRIKDASGKIYWRVTGLKVVDPSIPRRLPNDPDTSLRDQLRYSPGDVTTVTITQHGQVLYYLPGLL